MRLIKAGLLIDGTSNLPQTACYIGHDNGRITGIGRAGDFSATDIESSLDFSQYTIMPGLIDTHVHLFLEGISDAKLRTQRWKEDKDTTLLRAAKNLALTLKQGVTTVRDLGGPYKLAAFLKKSVRQGVIAGPRILTANQAISITGGHFYYAGGREADGPQEMIKAVREQAKEGADWIKIMMTGAVNFVRQDAGVVELSLNETQAVTKEAGHLKKPVSVHANGIEGVRQALDAHVTTLEHGALIDEDTVKRIAESGVYWIPTLVPFERMLDYGRNNVTKTMPAEGVARVYECHQAMVQKAYFAGAKIAAGTDAGALGVSHGDIWRELDLLVGAGLPHSAALKAATSLAAEALGIAKETGTIEPGKRADILVLDGDPLVDISSVRQVVSVFKDGRECW